MLSYRLLLCLPFLLLGSLLSAQEDCGNGLDDDGDGLIDLNDTVDCACGFASAIPSLLPNPSLEDFDAGQEGCESIQPGGLPDAPNQANCLVGWQRASIGTTDAWNAFTLSGSPPFFPSELPQPLPSGTGIAGFWIGVRDSEESLFTNGDGTTTTQYREYLAACLEGDNTVEAGNQYRLTFSLGFMQPQSFNSQQGNRVDMASPSPIELNIYGIRECSQIYFGDFYTCPETAGAEGYELIQTVQVTGSAGAWTPVNVNFTAASDYAAFAVGGSCAADVGRSDSDFFRNYYFIDDVILNRPEVFEQPVAGPVSVAGQTICADEITLTGQFTSGASYQWYKDGIALVGETANILTLTPSQSIDGAYALRVTTAGGCATTEDVVIQRPILADMVPDSVALCPELDTVFLQPTRPSGATFTWSDGSTLPYFPVTEPGDYSVTVSTVCEQQIETFTALETETISYQVTTEPETYCVGDTVRISVQTDFFNYGVAYNTLSYEPLFSNDPEGLEVVVGEIDSIVVQLFYGCGSTLDTVALSPDVAFDVSADVPQLSCENPSGTITLNLSNPDQVEFAWTDPAGNPVGDSGPSLEVSLPGTYGVELVDGIRCPATYTYEVVYADSFRVNLAIDSLRCDADGGASAAPSGGTLPYTVNWYRADVTDPFLSDTNRVDRLTPGDYRVSVEDGAGCIRSEFFTLTEPDSLTVTTATTFADCAIEDSGVLTVTASGGAPPYTYRIDGGDPQTAPVFRDLSSGTYSVEVQDSRGCAPVVATVTVTTPTPFTVELADEQVISLGDSLLLELRVLGVSPETGRAVWTPAESLSYPFGEGSTTVRARPARTTRYQVTYTSSEGCSQTAETLVVVDESVRIYVPSAFSPNGDGTNDELLVYPGPSVQRVRSFRVHDRWGGLVYEWTGEAGTGWDGRVGDQTLNPGTFFYLVESELVNGRTISTAGSVTLIR
ncbi:gliding motility-associated-like protein [Neolewinella xylanilytica]|uniref:Gliding motility-associated-like protein n=1 Tax=Neolewinella xylanilytica TaxID=1514080 RepID=A0A2S6IBP6_9BACT|nr:gliding motility-associated C-terminal domain-containing protein [Neolewinella xylanilytica]PPK88869.1 gliding motility-associated-like protein [Neolewinella xylanilytica]